MPTIVCPNCNQSYDVDANVIGCEVECAVCNTSFTAKGMKIAQAIKLHPEIEKTIQHPETGIQEEQQQPRKRIPRKYFYLIFVGIVIVLFVLPTIIFYPHLRSKYEFEAGKKAYDDLQYKQAIKHFEKASQFKHAEAEYYLALCYIFARGVSDDEENIKKGVELLKMSAENGCVQAQCQFGDWLRDTDAKEAAKWFMKAAEQGDPEGQIQLSRCYYLGEGVRRDYEEAFKWTMKAAEQNSSKAQVLMGKYYEEGTGTKKDYKEAAKWYLKAAEQGNPVGQCSLGILYSSGRGVEEDIDEAEKWFRMSAEQDDDEAQWRLGLLLIMVKKDEYEGKKWIRESADNGNKTAIKLIKEL